MRLRMESYQPTTFNLKVKEYLQDENLEDSKIESVLHYISNKNYLQILYDYGKTFIKNLIRFYESNDYFEECLEIQIVINNHNKATGERIDLKT